MSEYTVSLPDGSYVDISEVQTETGVNALLRRVSGMKLLSHMVDEGRLYKKREDVRRLSIQNMFFYLLAQNARNDNVLFRKAIPQSDIHYWLEYVMEEVLESCAQALWIETGELGPHTGTLVQCCESMFKHPVPVALALEGDFFGVLSHAMKARKATTGRSMPSKRVCDQFAVIVCQTFLTAKERYDRPWHSEKIFRKLESSGILEEFLRCVTIAQPTGVGGEHLLIPCILDQLQGCPGFLCKKFDKGEPCGDVLTAIRHGYDGGNPCRKEILNRCENIFRVSRQLNCVKDQNRAQVLGCSNCQKREESKEFQMSLLKCSRCKCVFYCSKDCQRAHWKSQHKKECRPADQDLRGKTATKTGIREIHNVSTMIDHYVKQHYVDIMAKLVDLVDENDLKDKRDVLIELDYTANKEGIVPALSKHPMFKIAPIRDYIEGSRPAEPEWYIKDHPGNYRTAIESMCSSIREHREKVQPDQILFFARYNTGASTFQVGIDQMFTQEAVDGFRSAFNKQDVEPLRQILTPGIFDWAQFLLETRFGVKSGLTKEEIGKGYEKWEPFIPMVVVPIKGDISKMDNMQLMAAAADADANSTIITDY